MKGRLAPGVRLEQAEAELATIAERLAREYPETNEGRKISLLPSTAVALHPLIDSALSPVAALLLSVAGLVLLIACSNVAGLMLVRAAGRTKEIAIRLAIGASRRALARQLLTESMLVALLAGLLGMAFAYLASHLLVSFKPPIPIPISLDFGIDGRVLGYTLLLSLATGIVFGLAPALQASRPDLVPTLKDEVLRWGRRHRALGLRNVLVMAQVAVSALLLVGAGLFVRSLTHAQSIEPGFRTRNAVIAFLDPTLSGYTPERTRTYYDELVSRVRAIPGVVSVALAEDLPLGASASRRSMVIEGQSFPKGKEPEIDFSNVGPGYFDTMGIPVAAGRGFLESDREGAPRVAIVNETMARRFWPGGKAVGKRIGFEGPDGPFVEIVGIARDGKYRTLGEDPRPYVYACLLQDKMSTLNVVARTATSPERLLDAVRREVVAQDSQVPLIELKTMEQHLSIMLFPPRMAALLLLAFGLVALVLATTGLYAVVAYTAAQRTREVGIRIALGARRNDVLRLVLGQGMVLVAGGVAVGLLAAFGLSRLLSSFLFGIGAVDPVTFMVVPALFTGVAFLASYMPARRATRVDPLIALRYE